VLQIQL